MRSRGRIRKEGASHPLCPRARPKADLWRERQGRPLHPIRGLDRDQLAQGRGGQDPSHRLRQLQDPGSPRRDGRRLMLIAERKVDDRAQGFERPLDDRSGPAVIRVPPGRRSTRTSSATLTDALGDLKIVGVRPKPPGLTDPNRPGSQADRADRGVAPEQGVLPDPDRASFPTKGTYRHDRGRGRLHPPLRRAGLRLRRGADRRRGRRRREEGRAGKKADEKKSEGTKENRYLMVTVSFDPNDDPQAREGDDQAPPTGVRLPDNPSRRPQGPQVYRRSEGGRGEGQAGQGGLREEDRRRPEEASRNSRIASVPGTT